MRIRTSLAALAVLAVMTLGGAVDSADASTSSATSNQSRFVQYHGTIGYPAVLRGAKTYVEGAPGTNYMTYIKRPNGSKMQPFGSGGYLPASGACMIAWGAVGSNYPKVSRVEVWSIADSPVTVKMQIY